jgi:hypothetical protein
VLVDLGDEPRRAAMAKRVGRDAALDASQHDGARHRRIDAFDLAAAIADREAAPRDVLALRVIMRLRIAEGLELSSVCGTVSCSL